MSSHIKTVVICDDVRRELNNKEILIGVYSGSVTVPSYPALIRLSFWFEIESTKIGAYHWAVKIETPSGNPPIEIEFDAEVAEAGDSSVVFPALPIAVERDGEIVISVKRDSEQWTVAKRKKAFRLQPPR
jgi:hypothetical protein